jgi:hypothetical protein
LPDRPFGLIDLAARQQLPRDFASDTNPEKCWQSPNQVISKSRSTTRAALARGTGPMTLVALSH